MHCHLKLLELTLAAALMSGTLLAQGDTLLLLHFNNSLVGADGETPILAPPDVQYEPALLGNGVDAASNKSVYYQSAGNINSTEGTLQFWIKPHWNGNDGQTHIAMVFGNGGGILVAKDGADNWRCIFNRYGPGGVPEIGAGISVSHWLADQWHHAAFTWDAQKVRLYVDGGLRRQASVGISLPVLSDPSFQINGEGTDNYVNAVLDEWQIRGRALSTREIQDNFLAALTVSNLTATPATMTLLETWRQTPTLTATTQIGPMQIPSSAASWTTSNASVAYVDSLGRVRALSNGSATLTATVHGAQATIGVTVTDPVLPPSVEPIDPFLATPAAGQLWEIPVLCIRFFPTADGANIDPAIIQNWYESLAEISERIRIDAKQTKFMLEEGSKFRGYKDATALPSCGYRVVHIVTVYEPMPPGYPANDVGDYFPDYNQILERFNAKYFVDTLGVKEVWLWGYHESHIVPIESNMASPLTGDISNSFRNPDDMPVFNSTYVLYNYNFTRGENENVEDHGHQLEAILTYINWRQDANDVLFQEKFCGRKPDGSFARNGRCGNVHYPPNGESDYDWLNMTPIQSDCEDWTPAMVGQLKWVNAATWRDSIEYEWPPGTYPADSVGRTNSQYFIYWMQNMPGRNNAIPYATQWMTNWWMFTGSWDAAITAGYGLYADSPLPVQLLNLSATLMDPHHVRLNWKTLTEINNYGFEVQRRSTHETQFTTLAHSFVPGHGTTNEPHQYTFTDSVAYAGAWAYRLKQIDLDGRVHYSESVLISVVTAVDGGNLPTEYAVHQNYPNPFNPSTSFEFRVPSSDGSTSLTTRLVTLKVFDLLGREVATLVNEVKQPGTHTVQWDASRQASGVYLYRLQAGSYVSSRKLVLMK